MLKYPLLLRELVSLTDTDSEEHYHLTGTHTHKVLFWPTIAKEVFFTVVFVVTEALKAMEKVASHINEMQKIYEDYGAVFDQLVAEQSGSEKEVIRHLLLLAFHISSNFKNVVTRCCTLHYSS